MNRRIRKIRIGRRTTRADLAALVTRALEGIGDHPILVGGAVVDIYTHGRYRSDDLDIITYRNKEQIAEVMHALGFHKKGMHWEHPSTNLLIQFLGGPAMVGNKHVRAPRRYSTRAGKIPMYSALDSACDRLAWFMEGEQQSFRQCVDVVVKQRVSLKAIERWLADEGWSAEHKQRTMVKLREAVARRRKLKSATPSRARAGRSRGYVAPKKRSYRRPRA